MSEDMAVQKEFKRLLAKEKNDLPQEYKELSDSLVLPASNENTFKIGLMCLWEKGQLHTKSGFF